MLTAQNEIVCLRPIFCEICYGHHKLEQDNMMTLWTAQVGKNSEEVL